MLIIQLGAIQVIFTKVSSPPKSDPLNSHQLNETKVPLLSKECSDELVNFS